MSEQPRRRGRPPKQASSRVGNLTFRIHDDVRSHIARSAEITGRTLTEEVEHRVQKSVRTEEEAFGGPETYALMLGLAQRLKTFERRFGKPWPEIDDPRFHIAAGRAFQEQIALCQADVDLRPLTAEELARSNEPIPDEPSEAEIKARGITMAEGEKLFKDDDDLPPDPDALDPSEPVNILLAAPPATPKRTRKQKL